MGGGVGVRVAVGGNHGRFKHVSRVQSSGDANGELYVSMMHRGGSDKEGR